MLKKKKWLFVVVFFMMYAMFAYSSTQLIPYLENLGFDVVQRGIIISATSAAAIVFQLIVGYLSDKLKIVKKIAMICLGIFGIISCIVYVYPVAQFIITLITVSILIGMFNTSFVVIDNWVLESEKEIFDSYSFIRAFGSLGWSVGSLICGQIVVYLGFKQIGLVVLIMSLATIIIASFITDAQKSHTSVEVKKGDYKKLLTYEPYVLLVVILFLINSVQTLNIYAIIDKIIEVNGTAYHVGLKNSIQAIIEVPIFIFGIYLIRKLNPYNLLKISAVGFAVQFIFFGLAKTPDQIMLITFLQVFTYPLLLMSQKNLLFELSPDNLKSSGQLVANSIAASGSALIIPILSGVITKKFGIDTTMYFGTFMGILGFLMALKLHKMVKISKN